MDVLHLFTFDSFDLDDFVAPLDPAIVAFAFVLGLMLGAIMRRYGYKYYPEQAFMWFTGGLVFYVPLSCLRALQGSTVWERFLATFILWGVFVLGIWTANAVGRWVHLRYRNKRPE